MKFCKEVTLKIVYGKEALSHTCLGMVIKFREGTGP
jgi:hypothetical protein